MSAGKNGNIAMEQTREVHFFVLNDNPAFEDSQIRSIRNVGSLVELDSIGAGMLTQIPLQPGDMVQIDDGGIPKLGVVMWSVESSNKFRIQMRFV